MIRIFIGQDSRFPIPAFVLAYSIRKYTSIPIQINLLRLEKLDFNYKINEHGSTEFTYSRFLIPYLCNYKGIALFMDNDMLCLTDIVNLFNYDMNNCALRVVKHDYKPTTSTKMYGTKQIPYRRKNWSSLMLMNCFRLKLWTKEYVENTSGMNLHQFNHIPDNQIDNIESTWNDLDHVDKFTKILHYTTGGPWFKEYENCEHANIWKAYYKEWLEEMETELNA